MFSHRGLLLRSTSESHIFTIVILTINIFIITTSSDQVVIGFAFLFATQFVPSFVPHSLRE